MILSRSVLLVAASSFAPAFSLADVHVVDASGGLGADFLDIQPAVSAAADGDVVLVRSGTYGSFAVDGRSLTVVADTGAQVEVSGTIDVANLSPAEQVVLAGIDASPPAGTFFQAHPPGIRVTDCEGPVLIQDAEVRLESAPTLLHSPLLDAASSSTIALVRFDTVQAANTGVCFALGGLAGVRAVDTDVALFDSVVAGGHGVCNEADGSPGIVIEGGALYASGSWILGGDGYDTFVDFIDNCHDPGHGGDGVLFQVSGEAVLLQTVVRAGMAGVFFPGFGCTPASDGQTFAGPGTVTALLPTARSFEANTPVRDGGTLAATFEGEPGDLVLAVISTHLAPTAFLPLANGPLLPGPIGFGVEAMGTVPADGSLEMTFAAHHPIAGSAIEAIVQGLFVTPSLEVVVSGAQSIVYLGPGL